MLSLFIKGLIIGFSIAAPVGPIGVLCINRSLHEGWKVGLATGIGAALADGIYGAIAGFGLTWMSNFLISHAWWIKFIGGCFLIYLGAKTFFSRPPKQLVIRHSHITLLAAAGTTFFLTVTNPMTILSFMAVFAGLGLGNAHTGYIAAAKMVFGIILGSLFWWLFLSTGVSLLFRNKIKKVKLYWVNFLSGLIIMAFGLIALNWNL